MDYDLIMKDYLKEKISLALNKIGYIGVSFTIEKPKEEKFGDYSTNAAMVIAKESKTKPRDIAKKIIDALD